MVRDVVTLAVGSALLLSQVIIQWQSRGKVEPNVALITAGVGLLTSWPFLKLGDRRADSEAEDGGKGR
jgi:hypothetical protein